jgi:hypothetical protein
MWLVLSEAFSIITFFHSSEIRIGYHGDSALMRYSLVFIISLQICMSSIYGTHQIHFFAFCINSIGVVHSPEGGAPESVSLRRCSQTSGECTRTGTWPLVTQTTLFLFPQIFFHCIKKKYFHGNMATGSSPSITP